MHLGSRPGSVSHCPETRRKATHFYFCFGKTRGWRGPVLTRVKALTGSPGCYSSRLPPPTPLTAPRAASSERAGKSLE